MSEEVKYNAIIMEIRAGVGGEEAALFAADLSRMYTRYAQNQGMKVEVLASSQTEIGGIKEIIIEISGDDVYSLFKNEAGVHRVQRIPETEKSGRIHTSTATVAILPKPKATEIDIKPQDIRVDTYKASGAGGQYVNKRMSAIRLTHIPTGEVVTCQNERSLSQNKKLPFHFSGKIDG
jgi:peptide chain release factor 1